MSTNSVFFVPVKKSATAPAAFFILPVTVFPCLISSNFLISSSLVIIFSFFISLPRTSIGFFFNLISSNSFIIFGSVS